MFHLVQFGRWELALKVLDEIGDVADIITYNSALHALSKSGQWEQAVALLHRMEAVGGATVRVCRFSRFVLHHIVFVQCSGRRKGTDPSDCHFDSLCISMMDHGHENASASSF